MKDGNPIERLCIRTQAETPKKKIARFRRTQSIIADDKSYESHVSECAVFILCAPFAVDNRSGKRKKKVGRIHWGVRPTPKRIPTTACGAAYGAWLPIVKAAAYLTDFMVDRIFRMNPGRWPLPGTRGTCAQVSRIDNRIVRYILELPCFYLSIKYAKKKKKKFPPSRAFLSLFLSRVIKYKFTSQNIWGSFDFDA